MSEHRSYRWRVFWRRTSRRIAAILTVGVLSSLAIMLLLLGVDKEAPGSTANPFTLFYLSGRRAQVVLLVGLLLGGLPLTVICLLVRGAHRAWLLLGWAAFLAVGGWFFGHRMLIMLEAAAW